MRQILRSQSGTWARDAYLYKRVSKYVWRYWKSLILAFVLCTVMSVSSGAATYSILPIMQVALEDNAVQAGGVSSSSDGESIDPSTPMDIAHTSGVASWLDNLFERIASQDSQLTRLIILAIVAFSLVVLTNLVGGLAQILFILIQAKSVLHLRIDAFEHINRLPLTYFDKNKAGTIISRLENDVGNTTSMVNMSLSVLFLNLPTTIVFLVLLIGTSLQLATVAFPIILIGIILANVLADWIRRLRRQIQEVNADLIASIQEYLPGIRVIKSFSTEEYELKKWWRQVEKWRVLEVKNGLASLLLPRGLNLIASLSLGSVFIYGGFLMVSSQIGIAQLVLFAVLLQRIQSPVSSIVNGLVNVKSGLAYAERTFEMMDASPQKADGRLHVTGIDRELAFNKVSFGYGHGRVLSDVDLHLPVGSMTALVGPSGVGKSTVADLLIRFYDPNEGNITLDGMNIQDLDLKEYRALFGVVTQETFLFHDTIKANIAYGSETATTDEIISAAQMANAHEFILELSHGYDTVVGDRGTRLSGGQAQRVAIARAVLRNPTILILDEATSSLDTESERQVQEAIDRLISKRTVLAIAHRLSTIERADNIVVLGNQSVIESGMHEELMSKNGPYKRLHDLQFGNVEPALDGETVLSLNDDTNTVSDSH